MADINYDAIKTEYLSSDVSLRSLSRKYGVSIAALSKKAKKDGWETVKETIRSRSEQLTIEKAIDTQVSIADKCLNIVNIMVDKISQAAELCEPTDTRAQKDIISMVDDLNQMGAFAFDGATSRNNITVEFIGMDDTYGV